MSSLILLDTPRAPVHWKGGGSHLQSSTQICLLCRSFFFAQADVLSSIPSHCLLGAYIKNIEKIVIRVSASIFLDLG
jgi:hypothetical protein